MSDDLDEIRERIAFAREEASSVEGRMRTFMRDAILITRERAALDAFNLYAELREPIPVALRAQAGTTANELRSCLDSLACTLAIRNQKEPKNTYFPASKSENVFKVDGMRKIRNMSDADKAKIVAMQPYKGGMPDLFELHEADRTRKHQRLAACISQQSPATIGSLSGLFGPLSNVKLTDCSVDGVYVTNFRYQSDIPILVGARPKTPFATGVPSALPLNFDIRISYSEPDELKGRDVVFSLRRWADLVEDVVKEFA